MYPADYNIMQIIIYNRHIYYDNFKSREQFTLFHTIKEEGPALPKRMPIADIQRKFIDNLDNLNLTIQNTDHIGYMLQEKL